MTWKSRTITSLLENNSFPNQPLFYLLCIDFYSSKHERFILIGDLNCEPSDSVIRDLLSDWLSDFHAIILSAVTSGFVKRGPQIKISREYKSYKSNIFIYDIVANALPCVPQKLDYSSFEEHINSILQKHKPFKKKYVRANNGAFMNKKLRKAIMHRSKLRNRYNKNKTVENFNAYKTQRNRSVKILRKTKRDYYRNQGLKDLTDCRKFWKTVKTVLTDTVQVCQSVALVENDEFLSEDLVIAEIFNHYFTTITKEVEIRENKTHLSTTHGIDNSIDIAIIKYSKHPGRKKIKETLTPPKAVYFYKHHYIGNFAID